MFVGLSIVKDSGHDVLIKKKASRENGPRLEANILHSGK